MGETSQNNVRALREAQLMSKAELARKAGLSPLTIDRVESGKPCRMDTKRKLILALGLKLADRHKVFPEESPAGPAPAPRSKRQRTREGEEPASGEAAPVNSEQERGARTATGDPSESGDEDSSPGEGRQSGSGRGAKSA